MLFHAFSTFFMKSMKKVEKAPKSKQGVFLMFQCIIWLALAIFAEIPVVVGRFLPLGATQCTVRRSSFF